MKTPIVMTVIGKDQPGLVESIAEIIQRHQGNWEESKMANLSGQFAGILRLEIEESQVAAFKTDIQSIKHRGLECLFADSTSPNEASSGRRVTLELVGNDQQGIVHRISQTLAHQGVNVESLETCCESAPWSGEALFKASASLEVPSNCDLDQLRDALETIAQELMVDFTLNQSLNP